MKNSSNWQSLQSETYCLYVVQETESTQTIKQLSLTSVWLQTGNHRQLTKTFKSSQEITTQSWKLTKFLSLGPFGLLSQNTRIPLEGLNNEHLFFRGFLSWKSNIKLLAASMYGRFPPELTATFFLSSHGWKIKWALGGLFIRLLIPFMRTTTLWSSHSLGSTSKYHHIIKKLTYDFGERTHISIYSNIQMMGNELHKIW